MSSLKQRVAAVSLLAAAVIFFAPSPSSWAHRTQSAAQAQAPQAVEWVDGFDGDKLDEAKWERYTFEGGGGGKVEVRDGQLQLRGGSGSRAGVRSREPFGGDRFIFEATVAKVGRQLPEAGKRDSDLGFATLCVLFDGSGRNRIEWILTSENTFEAWSVVDGRGERLDKGGLGTKEKTPTLGIVRRGDEFLFMLNGEEGLRRTVKNMPRKFHVMLYGFGTSENNWDSARVVTVK
ncbi:MAG TPA: hypothetical protein VFX96_01275 [Pyrinomonadaceae bacterium]|nr:hypothetical protein [Pyrinomonadaceae bacterium]